MKFKIKRILMTAMIFVSVVCSFFVVINLNNDVYIDKVLKSESYSYLPKEAKNYIEEVYEESGELILTEKNKEENVPYLNPSYVDYLTLSDEEKESLEIIPETYLLDYVYIASSEEEELPSTYDLRNIDGKSYITELKDQGNLGICWAFSAIEQAESYLMFKNNEPYNGSTQKFSPRQLDYAASTNGIKNYNNEYGRRLLGLGASMTVAYEIMSYGVSLVDEKTMPYDLTTNTNTDLSMKDLAEVLNYGNSLYEVDSTIEIPTIARTLALDPEHSNFCMDAMDDFDACYDSYVSKVKEQYIKDINRNIIKYGGGAVSTVTPQSACGFKNEDGVYVIDVSGSCKSNIDEYDGHGLHAIGFDDNYKYSYCDNNGVYESSINETCENGTHVTGTGAWILRNSWGKSEYDYVYLTYDTVNDGKWASEFYFVTSMTDMKNRNWDNGYSGEINYDRLIATTSSTRTFEKKIDGTEKLEKIKFHAIVQDGEFSVTIESGGKKYEIIDKVITNYPGIYTVDLSSENIIIEDSNFTVSINGNKSYLIDKSMSAYTSNVNKTPIIETIDISSDSLDFIVYSNTKNIKSNEKINYALFDGETELVDYLSVKNNNVAINNVNASVEIVKKLNKGEYTLKTSYGDRVYETKLTLNTSNDFNGKGTIDDPYLIANEEAFAKISDNLNAYYKLANDIELTKEWVPIGTEETPFTGGFDGNGYTITGLKIDDEGLDYSGLFGYVETSSTSETFIKNITVKDADINVSGDAGILIGYLKISKSSSITIDSIYIIGGSVSGYNAGSLIGTVAGSNSSDGFANINNVFSSSTISGSSSAGLIGYNYYQGSKNIVITNIQNIGITTSTDTGLYSSHSTTFIGTRLPYYSVSNFIVTGFAKTDKTTFNHLVGAGYLDNGQFGYYLKGIDDVYDNTDSDNGVFGIDSITELKNVDNYEDWPDFEKYWEIEPYDGITRIPILKGVDFDYTAISDIEIKQDEEVSLLDYITPYTDAVRIQYELKDGEEIIEVYNERETGVSYPSGIKIKGLKAGTTTLHVISNYDGYENDISITVLGTEKQKVHFYANNGTDDSLVQVTNGGVEFTLNANTFTKVGYTFKEWNTKEDGSGISYADSSNMEGLDSDIELYAQWEAITYSIVFNANGGSGEIPNIESTYDVDVTISENAFTKVGYIFKEWNTKADGSGTGYNPGEVVKNLAEEQNAEVILYAQWEAITYNIVFNANGGSGEIPNIESTYDVDVTISENAFTKVGYIFKEWNTKADGSGTGYNPGDVVKNLAEEQNAEVILYAQWNPITYNIVFDANGGAGEMSNIEGTYDVDVTILENAFTKVGYIFKEWNTKADGSGTGYNPGDVVKNLAEEQNAEVILYAQWSPITYNVVFNANGGTGSMEEQSLIYDEEFTLLSNLFEKEGYIFKEWNTESDGTGTSYSNNATVKNLTTGNSITLYAIWETDFTYTIKEYTVDNENKYIDFIPQETSLNKFSENILLGNGYTVAVELGTKTKIFTGSKTRIYKENTLLIEYTNIIRGDINADGKISALDYVKVKNHIMKTNIITDSVYIKAADANTDDKISSLDYVRIKNIIMKEAN